jgi:hypothetical protein
MPNKSPVNAIQPQQATTPLAKILASYNEGKGGPEGMTLLSILAQQKDPRAQKWVDWERQRQADIASNNNILSGQLPPGFPANAPNNYVQFVDTPKVSMGPEGQDLTNVVSRQPSDPAAYAKFMNNYNQMMLRNLGHNDPRGQRQDALNRANNLSLMMEKQRLANAVMPAEYSVMGEQPGSSLHQILKMLAGQPYTAD